MCRGSSHPGHCWSPGAGRGAELLLLATPLGIYPESSTSSSSQAQSLFSTASFPMETHTFGASRPFLAFTFSGPLRTLGLPPHFSLEPVFSLHLSTDSCPYLAFRPFLVSIFFTVYFSIDLPHTFSWDFFSASLWPPAPFCLHFFPASNLLLASLYLFSLYLFPGSTFPRLCFSFGLPCLYGLHYLFGLCFFLSQ